MAVLRPIIIDNTVSSNTCSGVAAMTQQSDSEALGCDTDTAFGHIGWLLSQLATTDWRYRHVL